MNKSVSALPLVLAVGLGVAACTPAAIKNAAPSIGKTVGKLEQPSQDVLPIITSEPVAADPEKAVANYRELLALTPDPETKVEAKRRLADLQVQMEDVRGNTAESEKALHEAVKIYNELLNANPLDKKNDRVFYQLARAQQNLGEVDAAIDTLQRLADRYPDSDLTHDGHFRRAELLFLRTRYAEAEADYRRVMDLGEQTQFFEQAQYKYGWSLYKQSKHEPAIATFLDILERELPTNASHDPEAALAGVDKAKQDLAKDSLRVITLSLSTLGGGSALSDYLARNGDPRFYPMLYAALGEALLEKQRYSDGAEAYAAFIERYSTSQLAPAFQTKVIAAYGDGGFRDVVVREKERYATTYDPAAPYWAGKTASAEVMGELRRHLEDLAKHYHALAQQNPTANKAQFVAAAGWYRRIIELYPQDPKIADINFLLGDSLLEGGRTLDAAREYAKTAYDYPPHARSGEAAYAAVLAHQKYAKEVPAADRSAALLDAIALSLKLADRFPDHAQRYPVLTQTTQDLYELKDYPKAIEVAARVIQGPATIPTDLRRIAWSVTGDAQFAQDHYAEAETAFAEELKLTAADASQRPEIVEQLAASIYKQGEAARAAEDHKLAAFHFLRVGKITPTAKIRAAAEYDGAASLIALEDWAGASRVLEGFRTLFPAHPLSADVDKKLAVAYQKDNKPFQAADAYGRIAQRGSESIETRREALWLSATLYDEAKAVPEAARTYETYVRAHPRPFARAIDARERLVAFARASGDASRLSLWLNETVTADDTAGGERSERSKSLAAKASLELGRLAAVEVRGVRLTLPVERSLPAKQKAMEHAIQWLGKAATYGYAEITTAATYELGMLYQDFGGALMASERPRNLSALEKEQYDLLLEEQAYPFEEKAIQTHETNLKRISQGVYNDWINKSAKALAQIAPARFGKREQGEDRYESLN